MIKVRDDVVKNGKICIKKNELFFFLSYGLYLFFFILRVSFFYKYFTENAYKFLFVFCIILLITGEITCGKYTIKTLLGLIIAGLLILAFYYSGRLLNEFAIVVIFAYCGRKVSFEKIIKFTIYLSSATLILIVFSSQVGIIENYTRISYNADYSVERTREYLGFLYALYGPAILFNITMLVLYIKKQSLSVFQSIILIMINYWMYKKTDARLSAWLAIGLILICLLLRENIYIIAKAKFLKVILMLTYPMAFIISLFLTLGYNAHIGWMRTLNSILGARLALGKVSIILYGVSFLGKKNLNWLGAGLDANGEIPKGNYLWVDNAYIQMLQRFGIIATLVIVLILTIVMVKCIKQGFYYLAIMFAFLAVKFMIDDLSLYLYYNSLWFAVGSILLANDNYVRYGVPFNNPNEKNSC